MVSKKDAIEIINYAEKHGITVVLCGGWGVDALLEKETREHNDIDLLVEKDYGEKFITLLKQKGFKEMRKEYTTPAHTVWQDVKNRIIDLHLYESYEDGSYLFENYRHSAGTFSSVGRIAGKEVHCITPQAQVRYHLGYELREIDFHDIKLLCEHFAISVPEEYLKQIKND